MKSKVYSVHIISTDYPPTYRCLRSVKIFLSGSGSPVSAALLVPGVSPMRSTLATETGANNPGLRLYKYDVGSGQVGLLAPGR